VLSWKKVLSQQFLQLQTQASLKVTRFSVKMDGRTLSLVAKGSRKLQWATKVVETVD